MHAVNSTHTEIQSKANAGRNCNGTCKQWKPWSQFDKKANGRNGRDSRCKQCIAKAKRSYKTKARKRYRDTEKLEAHIIGNPNTEKIERFSKIIATSIMSLIDQGEIR